MFCAFVRIRCHPTRDSRVSVCFFMSHCSFRSAFFNGATAALEPSLLGRDSSGVGFFGRSVADPRVDAIIKLQSCLFGKGDAGNVGKGFAADLQEVAASQPVTQQPRGMSTVCFVLGDSGFWWL